MISAYLKDTVVIRRCTIDENNVRSFRNEVAKARIDYRQKWTSTEAGPQMRQETIVTMGLQALTLNDMIRFDDRDWSITVIRKIGDFSNKYLEVLIA